MTNSKVNLDLLRDLLIEMAAKIDGKEKRLQVLERDRLDLWKINSDLLDKLEELEKYINKNIPKK